MAFTRTDITRRFGRCMSFINEDFKFKLLIAASDGSTCSSRWMANGNGTASRKCTPSSAVQHTIGGKTPHKHLIVGCCIPSLPRLVCTGTAKRALRQIKGALVGTTGAGPTLARCATLSNRTVFSSRQRDSRSRGVGHSTPCRDILKEVNVAATGRNERDEPR